jgi:hypothetical protein
MSYPQRAWTVERLAGRVVEIFVRQLESRFEVERFSYAIYELAVQTTDAIAIVDLRTPVVFSDDVATAVIDLMVLANSVRKKTAILLSNEHAVFGLQLGRLAKQAGDPNRRTFIDPAALISWLDADLTAPEKARVREFLIPKRVNMTNRLEAR